jgi:hypothetical protein
VPKTIRKFWPNPLRSDRSSLNFNWDAIDSDSVVLVTASVYVPTANTLPGANLQRILFSPDLVLVVENISPHGPPFDNNHGVLNAKTAQRAAPRRAGSTELEPDIRAGSMRIGWLIASDRRSPSCASTGPTNR